MDEASKVLVQMVNNDDVNKEMRILIAKKMYTDDYVFFKDLFEPNENTTLKSAGIASTVFETEFDNITKKGNLKSSEVNDLKDYLIANDLVLYVPYPIEDYNVDKQTPTISFHPLLNDSINIGYEPIEDGLEKSIATGYYNEVIVNEAYTVDKPVYLIVPLDYLDDGSTSSDEIPSSSDASGHFEIRIKKGRCREHYDNIFNGGSEIYFGNGTAQITNNHVSTYPYGFQYTFSRADIRHHRGKDINTLFISDWTQENSDIVMYVFEEDQVTEDKLTGIIKLLHKNEIVAKIDSLITKTVGNNFETSIEFERTWKSDDGILFNQPYNRSWFFATNNDPNAEWGRFDEDDMLIWRGVKDDLEWTMNVIERTY